MGGDRRDGSREDVHGASSFSPQEARAAWIEAARLRTLPLAASGSLIAAGIAASRGAFRPEVFALMLVVSVLLQVIANFADDYGDLSHGLDDETRVGPKRGMQRGVITPSQMFRALVVMCLATFALGCALIYVSFAGGPAMEGGTAAAMTAFLVLGIAAIAAAVFYTVGPHPYGYLGLGDFMSFIFFGLVAVIAGSFLYLHEFEPAAIVAALALGLPVAAVMNINNMRDSTADAAKGKRTIANTLYALGARKGRQIAQGASREEIAALAAKLEHGVGVKATEVDEALAQGGAEAVARATDPEHLAGIMGERYMRFYHVFLVYASLALFLVAVFLTCGVKLASFVAAAAVWTAFTPLMRSLGGVVHQIDHTKLDRFMAPTSLGTVLVAIVFALSVALASLF